MNYEFCAIKFDNLRNTNKQPDLQTYKYINDIFEIYLA